MATEIDGRDPFQATDYKTRSEAAERVVPLVIGALRNLPAEAVEPTLTAFVLTAFSILRDTHGNDQAAVVIGAMLTKLGEPEPNRQWASILA